MKKKDRIPTPTIAEILNEEFLIPMELTPYRLAKELHVSTSSILDILHGKRGISVEMSLRLSKFFGTSEKFWIN
jgi:addiction module HigA family antidote